MFNINIKYMERYFWKATLLPNMKEEYIKRHNNIWPELVEILKEAGICNYSIWINGDDVYGYYECEKGIEYASYVQSHSFVVDKWNDYMKDVMIMDKDPITGAQPLLEEVFYLK